MGRAWIPAVDTARLSWVEIIIDAVNVVLLILNLAVFVASGNVFCVLAAAVIAGLGGYTALFQRRRLAGVRVLLRTRAQRAELQARLAWWEQQTQIRSER